jgi:D-amino peptidase
VRVLIISDMEGISGIVRWEQVSAGQPMYEEGRRLYTADVNAAIRGAYAGGADDVWVMDWHGAGGGYSFNSLIPEELDERCTYVVQERIPQFTGPLDKGCDAAFLVGMHARAGTDDGIMNHTVFGSQWQELRFNGVLVGESGVNAALCGHFGCPVVLVTGDSTTCRQTGELLGEQVLQVPVKEGIGALSGVMIPPRRARALIEAGARDAIGRAAGAKPYDPGRPCQIEVLFQNTRAFDDFRWRPQVEAAGERLIRVTGEDWWTAWSAFAQLSVYQPSR